MCGSRDLRVKTARGRVLWQFYCQQFKFITSFKHNKSWFQIAPNIINYNSIRILSLSPPPLVFHLFVLIKKHWEVLLSFRCGPVVNRKITITTNKKVANWNAFHSPVLIGVLRCANLWSEFLSNKLKASIQQGCKSESSFCFHHRKIMVNSWIEYVRHGD